MRSPQLIERASAPARAWSCSASPKRRCGPSTHKQTGPGVKVRFEFSRQWVAVNQYYFYVHDREWGPAFLKIGTYLPYPVKPCLNGHEYSETPWP
jgi:hypothetical protein